MKNNTTVESIVSVTVIILTLALADVFGFWMPNAVHMMILTLLIIAFAVFAIFIWQESARDERELVHRSIAGRIGFLVGSGVLTTGIVIQSYSHSLDLWLVFALVAMVLSKILALANGRKRH